MTEAETTARRIGAVFRRPVSYYVRDPNPPGVVQFDWYGTTETLPGCEGSERRLDVVVHGSRLVVTRQWFEAAAMDATLVSTRHECADLAGLVDHIEWMEAP